MHGQGQRAKEFQSNIVLQRSWLVSQPVMLYQLWSYGEQEREQQQQQQQQQEYQEEGEEEAEEEEEEEEEEQQQQ